MKTTRRLVIPAVSLSLFIAASVAAQIAPTPPAQPAEIEAAYTLAIGKRVAAIVSALDLKDEAKAGRVTQLLTNQYRSLRARDEVIDAKLKVGAKDATGAKLDRTALFQEMSKPLHDQFLAKLATELTPAQIETVKDKMTYNKVKVTSDAYCAIVSGLKDEEKAKILEELKAAREEAIDGGSADEKTAIFQKHKDTINAWLNARGYDVAKATREWEAKQEVAKKKEDAR
jgi:hypothetical protein